MTQPDPTAVVGRRIVAALIDAAHRARPARSLLRHGELRVHSRSTTSPTTRRQSSATTYHGPGRTASASTLEDVDDRVYFTDDSDHGAAAVLPGRGPPPASSCSRAFTGWTPGKLVTGIRVVPRTGGQPGFGKALCAGCCGSSTRFLRHPGSSASSSRSPPGHRRVGDMAAKTFVVRAAAKGSPIVVPGDGDRRRGGAAARSSAAAALEHAPPPAPAAPAPGAVRPLDRPPRPRRRPDDRRTDAAARAARRHGSAVGRGARRLHPVGPGQRLAGSVGRGRVEGRPIAASSRPHRPAATEQLERSAAVEHGDRAQSAFEVVLQRAGGEVLDLGGRRRRRLVERLAQPAAEDVVSSPSASGEIAVPARRSTQRVPPPSRSNATSVRRRVALDALVDHGRKPSSASTFKKKPGHHERTAVARQRAQRAEQHLVQPRVRLALQAELVDRLEHGHGAGEAVEVVADRAEVVDRLGLVTMSSSPRPS